MFHVLIQEKENGKVIESIDIRRMKTEKLYELLGRYFLKFETHQDSFNQQGYREIIYKDKTKTNKPETTISFWRFADKDEVKTKVLTVVAKPEEPKEERIQVMLDAGVITKSTY